MNLKSPWAIGGALLALLIGGLVMIGGIFSAQDQLDATNCGWGDPGTVQAVPPNVGGAPVAGDPLASGGQKGSGLTFGAMPVVHATAGGPVTGRVRMAVANLPTKTARHRGASLRRMASTDPDFMAVNEVTSWSAGQLAEAVPGYGAYKDPVGPARAQALENAVLWNTARWSLVDAGRFEYVAHDLVVFHGKNVDWNRYATWALLKRRSDGAQVAIVSAHNMTNPQKQRGTHGDYQWPNRVAQYEYGMKLLRALVAQLSAYGPVLLAGDMNVHPKQGAWSAPDQLALAGMSYTYDGVIIYQFFPRSAAVLGRQLVRVDSDHPHALVTTLNLGGGGVVPVAAHPRPATHQAARAAGRTAAASNTLPTVAGFAPDQVTNATAVIAAGKALGVSPRGLAIGLMTAYGESKLHNINYGDRDSIGIFQQRNNGAWGTTTDRMDPYIAATNFFKALLRVPGWEGLSPTLAAHQVQANADPNYYAQFWQTGLKLYGALQGSAAVAAANPVSVICPTSGDTTGSGTSQIAFTASGQPYVGQFTPEQLMARAQAYVQAGTVDIYFHTVPAAGHPNWYRMCQHFVANLSGRSSSGYGSAADGWASFVATNAAHPAKAADGQSPPVGAWLYFKSSSDAAGHVVVYLGNNLIASTDLPTSGRVGIVPADAPVTQWHQTYLGWVAPWAAPNSGSKAA